VRLFPTVIYGTGYEGRGQMAPAGFVVHVLDRFLVHAPGRRIQRNHLVVKRAEDREDLLADQ